MIHRMRYTSLCDAIYSSSYAYSSTGVRKYIVLRVYHGQTRTPFNNPESRLTICQLPIPLCFIGPVSFPSSHCLVLYPLLQVPCDTSRLIRTPSDFGPGKSPPDDTTRVQERLVLKNETSHPSASNDCYKVMVNESSSLVQLQRQRQDVTPLRQRTPIWLAFAFAGVVGTFFLIVLPRSNVLPALLSRDQISKVSLDVEGMAARKKMTDHDLAVPPTPSKRCQWVIDSFVEKDGPDPDGKILGERYKAQSLDYNIFYRATAHIFWKDFSNEWGNLSRLLLDQEVELKGDVPLTPKSTWTWVTGDQHLSNFGAWRNRNGDVVFGINDFDEAAIYDFHIDVLRIAVSICNHASTNGFRKSDTSDVLQAFTKSYVKTVRSYIGNEDALLFELTPQTAKGKLQEFLTDVQQSNSESKQLKKFTLVNQTTELHYFIKGSIGKAHVDTRLAALPPELDSAIRAAFVGTRYGATMMKLGWNVRQWDDEYFSVLDVAGRVGSGIGSFGVDRFYVLLKGKDSLLGKGNDGTAVILDVKFEPLSAIYRVLDAQDLAWYGTMFENAASQVAMGQRQLTSYVDPFTGWIMLEDDKGVPQPFSVRQRSPWKETFVVESLVKVDDFIEFSAQIATATATSHVRGTASKTPSEFKQVIDSIMSEKESRQEWGEIVERIARAYHKQVLLDYSCFKEYVDSKYG